MEAQTLVSLIDRKEEFLGCLFLNEDVKLRIQQRDVEPVVFTEQANHLDSCRGRSMFSIEFYRRFLGAVN